MYRHIAHACSCAYGLCLCLCLCLCVCLYPCHDYMNTMLIIIVVCHTIPVTMIPITITIIITVTVPVSFTLTPSPYHCHYHACYYYDFLLSSLYLLWLGPSTADCRPVQGVMPGDKIKPALQIMQLCSVPPYQLSEVYVAASRLTRRASGPQHLPGNCHCSCASQSHGPLLLQNKQ